MREITLSDTGANCSESDFIGYLRAAKRIIGNKAKLELLLSLVGSKTSSTSIVKQIDTGTSMVVPRCIYILLGMPRDWNYLTHSFNLDFCRSSVEDFRGKPSTAYLPPGFSLSATPDPQPQPQPGISMPEPKQKEIQNMAQIIINPKPFFETIHRTGGVEISSMSKSEIFTAVSNQEAYIKSLKSVENKPKVLEEEIANAEQQLKDFLAHVDSLTQK